MSHYKNPANFFKKSLIGSNFGSTKDSHDQFWAWKKNLD